MGVVSIEAEADGDLGLLLALPTDRNADAEEFEDDVDDEDWEEPASIKSSGLMVALRDFFTLGTSSPETRIEFQQWKQKWNLSNNRM